MRILFADPHSRIARAISLAFVGIKFLRTRIVICYCCKLFSDVWQKFSKYLVYKYIFLYIFSNFCMTKCSDSFLISKAILLARCDEILIFTFFDKIVTKRCGQCSPSSTMKKKNYYQLLSSRIVYGPRDDVNATNLYARENATTSRTTR